MTATDPAAELRAAADLVERRSRRATSGPWQLTWRGQELQLDGDPDDLTPIAEWTYAVRTWEPEASQDRLECDTRNPQWIELMNPRVGQPIATWLRESAEFLDGVRKTHGHVTELALHNTRHALATARAINGEG